MRDVGRARITWRRILASPQRLRKTYVSLSAEVTRTAHHHRFDGRNDSLAARLNPMSHADAERCQRQVRCLLGAAVVWQVAYLFLTNFWGLFPAVPAEVLRYEMGEDRRVATLSGPRPESTVGRGMIGTAMDRWGEVTGQWQGWALFAPNVPTASSFLALELRWHAPKSIARDAVSEGGSTPCPPPAIARTVTLKSRFEPADPAHYWIPAWWEMRLYNYEWRLAVAASAFADTPATRNAGATENSAAAVASQQAFLAELLRREWRQFEAFVRMRLADYAAEHVGEAPPDDVVLWGRTYRPAPAGVSPWHWDGPRERPLARWRPGSTTSVEHLSWEMFDAEQAQFVPVRRDG